MNTYGKNNLTGTVCPVFSFVIKKKLLNEWTVSSLCGRFLELPHDTLKNVA